MCSSARYSVGSPFFPFTVTGSTSSWNTHASQACFARCCDARATSSTSFRVSLYFSARPSAVSAMDRPHCGSFSASQRRSSSGAEGPSRRPQRAPRSEEHTSELQSRLHLVCRLLLEKKKKH